MLNRQSSSSPFAFALLRSRSAMSSKSAISWRVGWCRVSHPFFCQSLKLIIASDQVDLLSIEDAVHEGAVGHPFLPPLPRAKHERSNLAAKLRLLAREQVDDLF